MAQIVTITNPLTGQPTQVDQLEHTAQQIDDGLSIARVVSSQNLLDNWYFGNPVNQRGVTSCTGGNYSIDRWALGTSDPSASLLVDSGGISITASSNKNSQFIQGLGRELSLSLVGKTITISALLKNVSGKFSISFARGKSAMYNLVGAGGSVTTTNSGLISTTFTVPNVLETSEFFNVTFTTFAGGQSKIEAVKLELGDQQTLAHQDANGNWVLNEIPDYGEQLRRCQRYFRKSIWSVVTRNSGTYWAVAYDATGMRAIPSCTIEKLCYIGNADIVPSTSDVMVAQSLYGSILLYANIPTLNSSYPDSTSCGIIFTLSADL